MQALSSSSDRASASPRHGSFGCQRWSMQPNPALRWQLFSDTADINADTSRMSEIHHGLS